MRAKEFFEAKGRSAASRGLPINADRASKQKLPKWAREAWARGWLAQGVRHG